jgi:hypothetical protein
MMIARRLFAPLAPFARHTRATLPPDTHPIAFTEMGYELTFARHGSSDLVAWNQRVCTDTPVIIDEMNVAMTNSAVFDGYFNIEWSKRFGSFERIGL